ncbi:unnamed protein product [Linum trigynum]|uniref:Uncharacterized protein n=1 Tax=Linum trigynum TaxID=586398 RepID=A0AAV2CDZ8_9ROSI
MWRDALASLLEIYRFVGRLLLSFFVAILQAAIANQVGTKGYRTTAAHVGSQFSDNITVAKSTRVPSPGFRSGANQAVARKLGCSSSYDGEPDSDQQQTKKQQAFRMTAWRFKLPSASEMEWMEETIQDKNVIGEADFRRTLCKSIQFELRP